MLASSLLKLTSQTSVDHESDEATKKREEVAAKLMAGAPDGVLDVLDASLDYARCQAMYDHVVDDVERLLHRCETATLYLERLRKSLPVQQLMQLDLKEQVCLRVLACRRGRVCVVLAVASDGRAGAEGIYLQFTARKTRFTARHTVTTKS